jgi:hypothetical protein
MRFIALDVHSDFCEVAIKDRSGLRLAGRVKSSIQELELFAASLCPVRARHGDAHLLSRQAASSAARPQSATLRFSSSSPAPETTLSQRRNLFQTLDFLSPPVPRL